MSEASSGAASPRAAGKGGATLNRKALVAGLLVVLPLLAILVANLGRDPHSVRSPLIGRTAPAFALPPVDGGHPVTLESLKGKPVVINFWATWCVPCYQEHPALNGAAQAMQGDVQFLGCRLRGRAVAGAGLPPGAGQRLPVAPRRGRPHRHRLWRLRRARDLFPGRRGPHRGEVRGPPRSRRPSRAWWRRPRQGPGEARARSRGASAPRPGPGAARGRSRAGGARPGLLRRRRAAPIPPSWWGRPKGAPLEGAALDARTDEIASLLRCPVCQGLSVADSPATMAQNMKAEVRGLVARGYTEDQVLAYFESSYGEFVRLQPPLRGVNWLVWLGPLAGLLAGGAIVTLALRRSAPPARGCGRRALALPDATPCPTMSASPRRSGACARWLTAGRGARPPRGRERPRRGRLDPGPPRPRRGPRSRHGSSCGGCWAARARPTASPRPRAARWLAATSKANATPSSSSSASSTTRAASGRRSSWRRSATTSSSRPRASFWPSTGRPGRGSRRPARRPPSRRRQPPPPSPSPRRGARACGGFSGAP